MDESTVLQQQGLLASIWVSAGSGFRPGSQYKPEIRRSSELTYILLRAYSRDRWIYIYIYIIQKAADALSRNLFIDLHIHTYIHTYIHMCIIQTYINIYIKNRVSGGALAIWGGPAVIFRKF